MSEPWAWQLPGPRRWTVGVTAKVRAGSSVVVEIPSRSVRAEVVEVITAATRMPAIRVDNQDLWTASDQRDVRMLLGSAIDVGSIAPSIQDLSSMAAGNVVELICEVDDPTPAVLDVIEQVARYSDLRSGPRFIVGAPPGIHGGGPRLSVVPFRRVVERPDTAAYVHGRLRQQGEHVDEWHAAAITELAAFDLNLADRLVEEWDGRASTVDAVLEPDGRTPQRITSVGVLQTRSSRQFESEWASGKGDWWDAGRFVAHLRFADDDEVERRLWFASLRSTWPEIEATRSGLIDWVQGQHHVLNNLSGPPAQWELSDLANQLARYYRQTKPKVVALARDLREARNDIAHMRPASADIRSRLRRLIPEAENELP